MSGHLLAASDFRECFSVYVRWFNHPGPDNNRRLLKKWAQKLNWIFLHGLKEDVWLLRVIWVFSVQLRLETMKQRVDSFAAYAYTRRIFNAYPVANKRVDKHQKNYPCETYIVFSVNKMCSNTAEGKESVRKLISSVEKQSESTASK